ncbi:MAG: prolyl oligopeptidase family serine peptidase [Actinomycetota bacterium]|nr:prolyl oligopeptidase family serine peptidase [Actinomycetota bacterium]
MPDEPTSSTSPYADLDAYLDVPRMSGLALSPDGMRLVTTVATLGPDRTRWVSALWEVDPVGERPARRLTRSAKGEGGPVFAPDGSLLFTSARPDPGAAPADDAPAALWLLPSTGEARVVATRPGGFGPIALAREAGTVVALSDTLPGATDGDSDAARRTARKDAGVDAVLHASYPVRYWDHDLGAGQNRLLAGELADAVAWRDLTPAPGRGLHEAEVDISPDGRTAVVTWSVADPRGSRRTVLVAVDTTTGERTTLFDDAGAECGAPVVSPDGSTVAFLRETLSTPQEPIDTVLVVVPLDASAEAREVTSRWDLWPGRPAWTPDGTGLVVVADERGAAPVFRIDVASGEVVRLTGDRGHYTDVRVSPDGRHAYALRDAIDTAPAPVRLDLSSVDQAPVHLQGPPTAPAPPVRLEEVTAGAEDGSRLRSWLVLPEGQGPFPLLLWVHGGPVHSWNGWSWRWNPHLMAARGYAVLLPDPALSTGYGRDFVRRGWGRWGAEPYTDLMAVTDAALEHPRVDPTRTAAMGGSFGGYMANWIAGHTDRFRAVVTHASLWDLDQFGTTTDAAYYWSREMTPQMTRDNSPSRFAEDIRSPMLVIHGDKDYRVPIGEGLRLWWDLCSRAEDPETMPHRFLYFPSEHHWVLSPGHAKVWYQTVLAFLAVHVLDEPWRTPDLLQ